MEAFAISLVGNDGSTTIPIGGSKSWKWLPQPRHIARLQLGVVEYYRLISRPWPLNRSNSAQNSLNVLRCPQSILNLIAMTLPLERLDVMRSMRRLTWTEPTGQQFFNATSQEDIPQPIKPIEPKFSFISFGSLCIFCVSKGTKKETFEKQSETNLRWGKKNGIKATVEGCPKTQAFSSQSSMFANIFLFCPHNICCLQLFVNVGRLAVGGLEANIGGQKPNYHKQLDIEAHHSCSLARHVKWLKWP